jgi:hypothetical protein
MNSQKSLEPLTEIGRRFIILAGVGFFASLLFAIG